MNQRDVKQNLSHIYDHVARNEVYRGYRSIPVATTGVIAVLAAVVQPLLITPVPLTFLLYWTSVAVISVGVAGIPVYLRYQNADTRIERRRTRKTVGQLLPAIVSGALLTICMYQVAPGSTHLLPGLWAMLFGLGLYSSRPYLPAATEWVAFLYVAAGLVLLFTAPERPFSPWGMGITFGVGQFASASVLYCNIERSQDERT